MSGVHYSGLQHIYLKAIFVGFNLQNALCFSGGEECAPG
jgi:hypothetical protein